MAKRTGKSKIKSDFVENQKRIEKMDQPIYSNRSGENFYIGYIRGIYIGQTSTSKNWEKYNGKEKGS